MCLFFPVCYLCVFSAIDSCQYGLMDIYFILLSSNPLVLNFIVHIVASGALSVDSWIPFSFPSSNVAVFIFVFLTFPYIHYYYFFCLRCCHRLNFYFLPQS